MTTAYDDIFPISGKRTEAAQKTGYEDIFAPQPKAEAPPPAPVVKSPPLGELTKAEQVAGYMVKPVDEGEWNVGKFLRAFTPIGPAARLMSNAPSVRPMVQGGADAPVGAAQLLMNAAGQGDKINPWVKQKEQEYQATRSSPGSFDPGRMSGNILSPLLMLSGGTAGGASAVARAFNSISTPAKSTVGRIPQGAAIGGISGATNPMEDFDWGGKALQTGAGTVLGGAPPAIWELAKMFGRGGRNLWQSQSEGGIDKVFGRMANRTAGDKRDEILKLLENAKANVPGSPITAGQASVPANRAEFAALQTLGKNANPSLYDGTGVYGQQKAAREASIGLFAQDPAALKNATQFRTNQATADYGKAYSQAIKADPQLMALADDPFFQKAQVTAKDLAGHAGVDPKTNLTQYLHLVKEGLDKQLAKVGEGALHDSEKRAVVEVKNKLLSWLDAKNQPYKEARNNFIVNSVEPTQMRVGQELLDTLKSPLKVTERPAALAKVVRDDDLGKLLLPQNNRRVEQVMADLENNARFKELSQGGMEQARKEVGAALPSVPSQGFFSPVISAGRAAVNALIGKEHGKVLSRGGEVMLDPKLTALLMKNASPYDRQALLDILMKQYATGVGSLPQ